MTDSEDIPSASDPNADFRKHWPHTSPLISGRADPLLPHLDACFQKATSAKIAVAFVMERGVEVLRPSLEDLVRRGGALQILTGDYFQVTEPAGLDRLLDLGDLIVDASDAPAAVTVRIFETTKVAFHPKVYVFFMQGGEGVAFVGSSNLSQSALGNGVEWNYRIIKSSDGEGFTEVVTQFDALFLDPATVPVTPSWIREYRDKRRPDATQRPVDEPNEEHGPPTPWPIQQRALDALRQTREAGNKAGLVVLATGLGKTWLAAFDSVAFASEKRRDPESLRILFVAHREEILDQARGTFRRVRPRCKYGMYSGAEKIPDATMLFASVQTLSQAKHLHRFPADHFDYIIVDEFHHAAARTYREIIEYFTPEFLLGLTATPERTDGGDLLPLCGHNLVFSCNLAVGVREGQLCAFRYFGVPDQVDYASIRWNSRTQRFDEEELTRHLSQDTRAQNALEQFQKHGGARGLGFCSSIGHAEFMAEYFSARGVPAVAVHSKESSAPRSKSLHDLREGRLRILFSVDMFNEGVDVENVDTVLMLRPTESRILWLQQFGRGLRKFGDKVLAVIDYIGNHRVFLTKIQAMFAAVLGGDASNASLRDQLARIRDGVAELPPGCEITYELEVIDILAGLLRPTKSEDQLREDYELLRIQLGERPTACEMFLSGGLNRATLKSFGSWFGLVQRMGDLDYTQQGLLDRLQSFFQEVESSRMERSYKMVVLEAMIEEGRLPGTIDVQRLTERFQRIIDRSPRLRRELAETMASQESLIAMLKSNPLRAWAGTKRGKGSNYFQLEGDRFSARFDLVAYGQVAESTTSESLCRMVRELIEWRLAEYLEQAEPARVVCSVIQNAGQNPIIRIDRQRHAELPSGETSLLFDDAPYIGDLATGALNAVWHVEDETHTNRLPDLLRAWFGPSAGQAGRADKVLLELAKDAVVVTPYRARTQQALKPGRSYMREEIPPMFGVEFTPGRWLQGFVPLENALVLLVTLDKTGKAEDHRYEDRFLSQTEFQWQSQNKTTQDSKHGRMIRDHQAMGLPVHLFVRQRAKTRDQKGAPFVYRGELTFKRWEGNGPITVWWSVTAHPT